MGLNVLLVPVDVPHAQLPPFVSPALTLLPEMSTTTVSASLVSLMLEVPYVLHAQFFVKLALQLPLASPVSPKTTELLLEDNVSALLDFSRLWLLMDLFLVNLVTPAVLLVP